MEQGQLTYTVRLFTRPSDLQVASHLLVPGKDVPFSSEGGFVVPRYEVHEVGRPRRLR